MAKLPQPTGLDTLLLEIATALGQGARALPEESRSAVGAVALKRAEVEVKFDMTSRSRGVDGIGGLGIRHGIVGSAVALRESEQTGRNTGRIALEVVAINDMPAPEPSAPAQGTPDIGGRPGREGRPGRGRPSRDRPAPAQPGTPTPNPAALRAAIATARKLVAEARRAGRLDTTPAAKIEATLDSALAALASGDLDKAQRLLARVRAQIGEIGGEAR